MEHRGVEYSVQIVESPASDGDDLIEPGEANVEWQVQGGPSGSVQGSDENAVREAADDAKAQIDRMLDGEGPMSYGEDQLPDGGGQAPEGEDLILDGEDQGPDGEGRHLDGERRMFDDERRRPDVEGR